VCVGVNEMAGGIFLRFVIDAGSQRRANGCLGSEGMLAGWWLFSEYNGAGCIHRFRATHTVAASELASYPLRSEINGFFSITAQSVALMAEGFPERL
jgi:hypothetical protein